MTISVDPSSAAPLASAGPQHFLEWTGRIDLLLPNAAEAATLAGEYDPAAAARALSRHARAVVVTLAAEGALWTDGEHVHREAPSPGIEVVDSTGAGDAFAAGYIGTWLRDASPPAALAAGCRLAERALAAPGARP
jgi:sugar/nucleoside kinase (ribokinase family)